VGSLPRIVPAAFEQARSLGNSWVGPDHFLLAALAAPSPAAEALAELGLTHGRLLEYLRSHHRDSPKGQLAAGAEPQLNPASYRVIGWAQGFAAAAGLSDPEPADWLLSVLYLDSLLYGFLGGTGVSAHDIMAALRHRGVRVPEREPHVEPPMRGFRRVDMSEAELEPVLKLLNQRHPAGSEWRWGFNYVSGDPRSAYVVAEEGIDLDAIVAQARTFPPAVR
jgi:hypothetical protein